MKRFLPLIIFLIGLVVLMGAYLFLKKGEKEETIGEESSLIDVPLAERPIVSLTPSPDGHSLKLGIKNIKIKASTLDYELLYLLPDGRVQGVPGTINLEGNTSFERDLLLGSESSGKFRYDEGVETGTISIRFRNDKGKLVAKFSTKFHLQSGTKNLTLIDGRFSLDLDKIPTKIFFVTMQTFGLPSMPPISVKSGPYGIFASDQGPYGGKVFIDGGKVFVYQGEGWKEIYGSQASDVGIFVAGD